MSGVMKGMKRKMSALLIALSVATISVLAVPTAANAMTREDYNLVCQYNHGFAWKSVLSYPSQGAYGWRCYVGITPATRGLDIASYCRDILGTTGARTNNPSDPYSWYCY